MHEGFIQLSGLGRVKGVDLKFNARSLEAAEAGPAHLGIGILHSCYHLLDPGGDDRAGAGRSAALMGARFESQIEGGVSRSLPGFVQCEYFRVFHSGPSVETAPYHRAIAHDDGAHGGSGAYPSQALGREIERLMEVAVHGGWRAA